MKSQNLFVYKMLTVKENLQVLVVPKNPLWKSTMFKNGKWENASNIELTEKKSNFGFLLK